MLDHQSLGTIFYALLAFVGGVGIVTGYGVRSTLTLPLRIALLLFIAFWPFLMIVAYALLGAFDETQPTPFAVFWMFVVTPLFSATALLGLYISWGRVCFWIATGSAAIHERFHPQSSKSKSSLDSDSVVD